MRTIPGKLHLRFKAENLDILQKYGSIYFVNTLNKPEHVCVVATIVSSYNPEFEEGDEAIVSYRIAWDENVNDRGQKKVNPFFIEKLENGDELRWCSDEWYDVFGTIKNGKICPRKEYVFAEIPPLTEEKIGMIIIPDTFRNQKTDKQSYTTNIKYIHPEKAKEFGLKQGDKIYASKDSDIKKTIMSEELLFIPLKKVLGYRNSSNFVPLAT